MIARRVEILSPTSLAQHEGALINCSMFGVTTSDDYQPVTWVGRHPVHVTTLLVAVHVFLLVLTCFSGFRRRRDPRPFHFRQRSSGDASGASGRSRPTLSSMCLIRSGSSLVRGRNVHAVRVRPRSGTLHRPARVYMCFTPCFSWFRRSSSSWAASGADSVWPAPPRSISASSWLLPPYIPTSKRQFLRIQANGLRSLGLRSAHWPHWPATIGPT